MTSRRLGGSLTVMAAQGMIVRAGALLALAGLCALLVAAAGPSTATAGGDRYCPKRAEDPILVSRLVDKRVRVARRMARRHDCVVRVVRRNGEWLAVTDDYRTDRVNVIVRDRRIKRIHGVY